MWKGFNSLNVWAHSFSNDQGKTTTKILLHFYWRQGRLRLASGIICLLWSAVCLLLPGSLHILVTWFWSTLVKVHIFWEGNKILRNLPNICPMYCQSNNWWRFRKILWPSQNIWTLPTLHLLCLCFSLSFRVLKFPLWELTLLTKLEL